MYLTIILIRVIIIYLMHKNYGNNLVKIINDYNLSEDLKNSIN